MPPPLQLEGQKFGELTVVALSADRGPNGIRLWVCSCSCGKTAAVRPGSLKSGRTKSCGHRRVTAGKRTHGAYKDKEYEVWNNMRQRCNNPKHPEYKNYGARGISVCVAWSSFETFLADMGRRPFPKAHLDRRNNDGNYEPTNCRWVTNKQNARNHRRNRVLTHNGESLAVSEWAERLGVYRGSILKRLRLGWSVADAVTLSRQTKGARNERKFVNNP
jgi:hypothetical protein